MGSQAPLCTWGAEARSHFPGPTCSPRGVCTLPGAHVLIFPGDVHSLPVWEFCSPCNSENVGPRRDQTPTAGSVWDCGGIRQTAASPVRDPGGISRRQQRALGNLPPTPPPNLPQLRSGRCRNDEQEERRVHRGTIPGQHKDEGRGAISASQEGCCTKTFFYSRTPCLCSKLSVTQKHFLKAGHGGSGL